LGLRPAVGKRQVKVNLASVAKKLFFCEIARQVWLTDTGRAHATNKSIKSRLPEQTLNLVISKLMCSF